jgi:ATP-dependent Clp protease ATP-binding subunit ClpB
MDINRFTEKAREALQGAQKLAIRMSHQQIDDEHLLLSLLDQEGGLTSAILKKAGVAPEALTIRLQRELEKLPRVSTSSGAPDNFYLTATCSRSSASTATGS